MKMGEGGPARTAGGRVREIAESFREELLALVPIDDRLARAAILRQGIDCLELDFSFEAAMLADTVEFDPDDPTTHTVDVVRHDCKVQYGVAADRLNVGQHLTQLEKTVQAVREGEIGFAHLSVMARALNKVEEYRCETSFPEDELLEQARSSTPGRFWHYTKRVLHAISADLVAAEQRFRAEQRWLRFSDGEDGSVAISGVLDSIGAATVRSALEPLGRRMGEGDDRCYERRQGDALIDMSMMVLDSGRLPHVASQRPHLQVTTTLETLCGKPGAPAAEMEFSEPISSKTVQRIACDSSISRVIFGPGSVVLDAGRARRVVSSATRRALNVRDRHCQWPGCERPAGWSAAHHLVHWTEGGLTDMANLVLLCHRHHWSVHEGGWKLARSTDDRLLAIPPTYNFFHQPRAPDEPAAA
ncbi:MAG TPA: DUF222 domain-containing protein [Candidatus Dormibacteraeota bacterium]|nr:DUF222 domain-containing protein [Candidatus Dormibacteraeota bacterium]